MVAMEIIAERLYQVYRRNWNEKMPLTMAMICPWDELTQIDRSLWIAVAEETVKFVSPLVEPILKSKK